MSLKLKLFVKVAKRRISDGMTINEVLAEWPNLTEEEIEIIRKAIET